MGQITTAFTCCRLSLQSFVILTFILPSLLAQDLHRYRVLDVRNGFILNHTIKIHGASKHDVFKIKALDQRSIPFWLSIKPVPGGLNLEGVPLSTDSQHPLEQLIYDSGSQRWLNISFNFIQDPPRWHYCGTQKFLYIRFLDDWDYFNRNVLLNAMKIFSQILDYPVTLIKARYDSDDYAFSEETPFYMEYPRTVWKNHRPGSGHYALEFFYPLNCPIGLPYYPQDVISILMDKINDGSINRISQVRVSSSYATTGSTWMHPQHKPPIPPPYPESAYPFQRQIPQPAEIIPGDFSDYNRVGGSLQYPAQYTANLQPKIFIERASSTNSPWTLPLNKPLDQSVNTPDEQPLANDSNEIHVPEVQSLDERNAQSEAQQQLETQKTSEEIVHSESSMQNSGTSAAPEMPVASDEVTRVNGVDDFSDGEVKVEFSEPTLDKISEDLQALEEAEGTSTISEQVSEPSADISERANTDENLDLSHQLIPSTDTTQTTELTQTVSEPSSAETAINDESERGDGLWGSHFWNEIETSSDVVETTTSAVTEESPTSSTTDPGTTNATSSETPATEASMLMRNLSTRSVITEESSDKRMKHGIAIGSSIGVAILGLTIGIAIFIRSKKSKKTPPPTLFPYLIEMKSVPSNPDLPETIVIHPVEEPLLHKHIIT